MIKQLRQQNTQALNDVADRLQECHDAITSFSIVEDPNFKVEASKSDLSLSQLNEKLTTFNTDLRYLNELWVLKGLISEIEHADTDVQDLAELEHRFSNHKKLITKIGALDDTLVIKLELKEKANDLEQTSIRLLEDVFGRFFADADTFDAQALSCEFGQFMDLVDSIPFETRINHGFTELKLKWEAYLSRLTSKNLLTLSSEDTVHKLALRPTDESLNNVFTSALNFVKFINLLQKDVLKQFFANKLSNILIEAVSANINELINSNNETLIEVIDLAASTHWNLSIDINKDNFNSRLTNIYNNWLVDNFINKIRIAFKTSDLTQVKEIKLEVDSDRLNNIEQQLDTAEKKMNRSWSPDQDEPAQAAEPEEDNWDDGWQEEWDSPVKEKATAPDPLVKPEDDEDGWDDGWDAWDEDNLDGPKAPAPVEPKPVAKPAEKPAASKPVEGQLHLTTAKVTFLPDTLLEIVNDFQIESTGEIDTLISTILAFASQHYPKVHGTFVQFNDLYFLYKNIMHEDLNTYASKLVRQLKHDCSNELVSILLQLDVSENSSNVEVYEALQHWFKELNGRDLKSTNYLKFKEIVLFAIELVNNWISNMILSMNEITELGSEKVTNIIDNFNVIFDRNLTSINEEIVPSQNRVANFRFLVNNHLVDIIERFYQGEFYDITTQELIMVIERTFVKSELRDNYINEIIEFRNVN